MKKLMLSLLLVILLVGCATKTNVICPKYPKPSERVAKKFDLLAQSDKEIWEWGNRLFILCCKLDDCNCEE